MADKLFFVFMLCFIISVKDGHGIRVSYSLPADRIGDALAKLYESVIPSLRQSLKSADSVFNQIGSLQDQIYHHWYEILDKEAASIVQIYLSVEQQARTKGVNINECLKDIDEEVNLTELLETTLKSMTQSLQEISTSDQGVVEHIRKELVIVEEDYNKVNDTVNECKGDKKCLNLLADEVEKYLEIIPQYMSKINYNTNSLLVKFKHEFGIVGVEAFANFTIPAKGVLNRIVNKLVECMSAVH